MEDDLRFPAFPRSLPRQTCVSYHGRVSQIHEECYPFLPLSLCRWGERSTVAQCDRTDTEVPDRNLGWTISLG